MKTLDGSMARTEGGGFVVAFDRLIDRPPEKIWAALTEPAVLANWLGNVEVDLREGGAFVIRFRRMTVVMTGIITALEPGRLIEYSWLENYGMPGSMLRWEITPVDGACRLKLLHTFPPECVLNEIAGFLGGWHAFLDALPTAADGTFVLYADESGLDAGYRKRCLGHAARDEGAAFLKIPGVRLERLLPGPIERVWDHLTTPELLSAWYGDQSSIEPRQGGSVRLMGGHIRGTVTHWAPPHRLNHTWNVSAPGDSPDAPSAYPESYLTLTLEPQRDIVLLTLVHLPVLDRFEKQNAMGWQTFLDILSDTLAGRTVRKRREYMERSAARYGVDLSNLVQ